MDITIVMNLSNSKYHMYKVEVKKIMSSFGLKWNYGRSGWFGTHGSVVGEFEGSGRPVRLIVTDGGDTSIERVMVKLAELIDVDISAGDVEDVDVRSYMERNRDHYVELQLRELMERGCGKEKAKRLNDAYGKAFDKIFCGGK